MALADKLDMLVGFWAIDEKPTGSKDPYALRRAALGIIRIVLDNKLRIPLRAIIVISMIRIERGIQKDEAFAKAFEMEWPSRG